MAKLFIKGQSDAIEISNEGAENIKKMLKEAFEHPNKMDKLDALNQFVSISNLTIRLSEIKSILKDSETVELSDEEAREFERELDGRNFEQYAIETGIYLKNKKYPNGAVVYDRSQEYYHAKKKMRALENLQERRWYAQKMEHEAGLNGEKCQSHSLNRDRCTFCWPWSLREHCIVTGKSDLLDKLGVLYDKMNFPKPKEPELCDKCRELKEECVCVNLNQIPF